jgi:leucyl aminopeptidase
MKILVSDRSPAKVAGDVVVQVFEPPFRGKMPLAAHLSQGARKVVNRDAEAMTWLEPRRMVAPRVLMASLGARRERSVKQGFCGSLHEDEETLVDRHALRALGAEIERSCHEHKLKRVVLAPMPSGFDPALVVEGMMLRAYGLTEFRDGEAASSVERVHVCVRDDAAGHETRIRDVVTISECTNYARTLADLPGNIGNGPGIVARVEKSAAEAGLKMRVMEEKRLRSLKMGLILAVGSGAGVPPCVLVLEHNQRRRKELPTLVLVGKGLTHDTGGYNLKTIEGLHDLTYDKAGGMAVIGAMHAVARLGVEAHVVGVIGLVENCIDANAYKPGDILTAMDETTVYVENTDAEGRLVLADCLAYAKRYEPDMVVDVATLTGACSIALGAPFSGLFCNDDRIRDVMLRAGQTSDDLLWPLPIHPEHRELMGHRHAQLRNVGPRTGGASTAAAFLRHFVDYSWAHLDIAGKASFTEERDYAAPGATGFGCRLLVHAAQALASRGQG